MHIESLLLGAAVIAVMWGTARLASKLLGGTPVWGGNYVYDNATDDIADPSGTADASLAAGAAAKFAQRLDALTSELQKLGEALVTTQEALKREIQERGTTCTVLANAHSGLNGVVRTLHEQVNSAARTKAAQNSTKITTKIAAKPKKNK